MNGFRIISLVLAIILSLNGKQVQGAEKFVLKDNYPGLEIPMTEFGFRGIALDGAGILYLSALLKNGVYLFPSGCRKQDCANFIRFSPPLSDPGKIIGLPGGGAFVLLRMADRINYVPSGCGSAACVRTMKLPARPSYPSSGVVDRSTGTVWVTEQLANQISRIPRGCYRTSCMTSINLPSRESGPSGIAQDPGKGLWITERNGGHIAFLPKDCALTSCVREYLIPYQGSGLHSFSPVMMDNGMFAFLMKGGRVIGIGQPDQHGITFHFMKLEQGVGKVRTILADKNHRLILLTSGVYTHVGRLVLSKDCLSKQGSKMAGCLDLRVIPIANAEPFALYAGRGGSYWITLRNLDSVVKFRLTPDRCIMPGKNLLRSCYQIISFARKETLYHKTYHQEVSH
ncbi:MAG: NHL repeat-containing protein [Leptospirales bacterium]